MLKETCRRGKQKIENDLTNNNNQQKLKKLANADKNRTKNHILTKAKKKRK